MNWKSSTDMYATVCNREPGGSSFKTTELSSVPCVDSDRWDVGDGVGGRPKRRGYMYI